MEASVGEQYLWSDGAGPFVFCKGINKRFEPVIGDLSVIVQEEKIFPPCPLRATVTRVHESKILFIPEIDNIRYVRQHFLRSIRRSVINHYDFVGNAGRIHHHRAQALERELQVVECRNDDRNLNLVRRWKD